MKCPLCGQEASQDDLFCTNCGYDLSQDKPETSEPAFAKPIAPSGFPTAEPSPPAAEGPALARRGTSSRSSASSQKPSKPSNNTWIWTIVIVAGLLVLLCCCCLVSVIFLSQVFSASVSY